MPHDHALEHMQDRMFGGFTLPNTAEPSMRTVTLSLTREQHDRFTAAVRAALQLSPASAGTNRNGHAVDVIVSRFLHERQAD